MSNKITTELAEISGIHAGDGYLRNGSKRHEIDISGHPKEDRKYYDDHVAPLFSDAFGINIEPREFPSRRTYGFVIRNKCIVNYFQDFFDFPSGKKAQRVEVPKVVLESENEKIYGAFLRGFFDADGCLTFQKRYSKRYNLFKRLHHTYPRIILTTISRNLADGLEEIMDFLDINYWEQIYRPKRKNWSKIFKIWIRGENMLKVWTKKVKPKNPSKLTRYKLWKKLGFCPPNTTIKERTKILKRH